MIQVQHLTKSYGERLAVSDLSFTIDKGQIYGFLGPNGAGKSTTMNIMTGCLAASSGTVTIDGYDIYEQGRKAKERIGYLPEQPPLYQDRTPMEYLRFVAQAKGIDRRSIPKEIDKAMEVTGIGDVSQRLIRNLSKGYRQRVGIAQAILGGPETIILDEPTVGLDPRQITEIRQLIKELGKEHTVILSSHILSEVQTVCQMVLMISKGKLVAWDSPQALERRFAGGGSVELLADCTRAQGQELVQGLQGIDSFTLNEREGLLAIALQTARPSKELCRELFFAFSKAGRPILEMTTQRASLEDVFLELTQSDTKEEVQ